MRSIGFLRLSVGVTLPLLLTIFSSLEQGVVSDAILAAAARPNDGVRMPPLRGRNVDGAWFPEGVTGRSPGSTGKGIIKPLASFLGGEGLSLFESVVLTGDGVVVGRDPARNGFGNERTGSPMKGFDFTGLESAGRSAKGMTGMDEFASGGITPTIFDLMADGAGVGSAEAGEECTCNVSPSEQ